MGKGSLKETHIAETIRARILSGRLAPGSKLPTYERLESEFPASRMTLARALNRLKADGFLFGVERKGVFVTEKLPNVTRIATLLAAPERENRFNSCIARDASDYMDAREREIVIYSNLNGNAFRQADADRLKKEIAAKRIAGIFVLFDPKGCPDKGIFDNELPKIYLSPGERRDGLKIFMDAEGLARRSLEWLKNLGAKRIAIISYPNRCNPIAVYAMTLASDFGLETRPEWQIHTDNPELAEPCVRLMLAAKDGRRPDGVLIADDHLVEHVARGVVAEMARVPEEIKIISHCNWSMPPSLPIPIKLLGYETKTLFSMAVDAIDTMNAGRKPVEPLAI